MATTNMALELAILGLLKEQDLHGYELRRRLGELLGPIGRLSFGTLYPALNRLETTGALTVVKVSESRTGLTTARGRKVYGITKEGQEVFEQLLGTTASSGEDDKSFALRLAFARYLSSEARLRLLHRRREQLTERLEETQDTVKSRQGRLDDYGSSLMEHRIEMTQNDLAWLDRLIASENAAAATLPPAVSRTVRSQKAKPAAGIPSPDPQ
jgi:DNA-binding PadR family transcriptional regulator